MFPYPPFTFFSQFIRSEAKTRNDPSFMISQLTTWVQPKQRDPQDITTSTSVCEEDGRVF